MAKHRLKDVVTLVPKKPTVHPTITSPGTELPSLPSKLKNPPPGYQGVTDLWFVKAGELTSNPVNWRKHPARQTEALQASITANGWAGACLYNLSTGRLIDGHARKGLDPNQYVPVLVGRFTERQERSLLATFDPISAMATSNDSLLKQLTDHLLDPTALAQLTAAERAQQAGLERLLGSLNRQAGGDHGKLPAIEDDSGRLTVPTNPVTKPGDLWEFPSATASGPSHWLLCGDSTEEPYVSRLLAKSPQPPLLMVTDPPYGVSYQAGWREEFGKYKRNRKAAVTNDSQSDWSRAYRLFPGNVVYVWHAGLESSTVATNLEASGFLLRSQIIWVKQKFVFGRGDYHWNHEPCWYAVRKGTTSGWNGDRTQTTTWMIQNSNPMGGRQDDADTVHSTQKPVECMARPIRNHRAIGGDKFSVYDPFLGSGTTLIACEQLQQTCLAIELEPGYCELAVQRWELFTGRKAKRHPSR